MKKEMAWIIVIFAAVLSVGAKIVPSSFNYQGVLRGGDGSALPAGDQKIDFNLYTAATDGIPVWGHTYTVILSEQGLFNVELCDDEGTPLVNTNLVDVVANASGQLYIGIKVEGDSEIAPRQQLLSVPFAMMAGDVKTARKNFNVGESLTVSAGAEVAGIMQAKEVVIENGSKKTTLSVDDNSKLSVSGGLIVEEVASFNYGVAVKNNHLHVYDNLLVDGTTELDGGLTVKGETQLFSRKAATQDTWIPFVEDGQEIIPAATSDGFVLVSLHWYFDLGSGGNSNDIDILATFKNTGAERSFNMKFRTKNVKSDKGVIEIKDVYTYPILKGESLTLSHEGEWLLDGSSYVTYKYTFIPFGTEN